MTSDLYSKFDVSIRWNFHSHMKKFFWIHFVKNTFSYQNGCFEFTTRNFWWDILRYTVKIESLLMVFESVSITSDWLKTVAISDIENLPWEVSDSTSQLGHVRRALFFGRSFHEKPS